MIFDDLSTGMRLVLAVAVPPALTLICWFASRRLAPGQPPPNKTGLSAMLLAAYVLLGIALCSSHSFAGTQHSLPTDAQVLQ
jgi:hypothetical protein